MFSKLKVFRKRLAGRIVTFYYERQYRKAVAIADERHKKEGCTIYVIDHFVKGRLLSTVNRKEFRTIKHAAQKLHNNPLFWSPDYGTQMLGQSCWYHTANGSEECGLPAKEREIRRLAFIRMGLKKARLYN